MRGDALSMCLRSVPTPWRCRMCSRRWRSPLLRHTEVPVNRSCSTLLTESVLHVCERDRNAAAVRQCVRYVVTNALADQRVPER